MLSTAEGIGDILAMLSTADSGTDANALPTADMMLRVLMTSEQCYLLLMGH